MSLPKINQPLHKLKIPSTGEEIRFRSFLVKEEKILIMANESGNAADIADAVVQVINNCIVTEGFDVTKLASFDIEWIFLNLRVRSVSDTIELNKVCEKCEKPFSFQIDLKEVQAPKAEKIDNKVEVDENIGMLLKYPDIHAISLIQADNVIESAFSVVASCIDQIYDETSVYDSKDYSSQELIDWVLELPKDKFELVQKFFEDLPQLRHETEVACTNCNENNHVLLEGVNDFLA